MRSVRPWASMAVTGLVLVGIVFTALKLSPRARVTQEIASGDHEPAPAFQLMVRSRYREPGDTEFGSAYATSTIKFVDPSHYSELADYAEVGVNGWASRNRVMSGTFRSFSHLGSNGQAMDLGWVDWKLPPSRAFGDHDQPDKLERLVDSTVPVVSMADVETLIAADTITDSGTTTLVGREAMKLDIPGGHVTDTVGEILSYQIFVDSQYGIKLASFVVRSLDDGEETEWVEPLTIELNAELDARDLDISEHPELAISGTSGELLSEGPGSTYPSAVQYTLRSSGELSDGFDITEAQFISATALVGDIREQTWVVTNELQASDNRYALVLQAPREADIPGAVNVQVYWPRTWPLTTTTGVDWLFDSVDDVDLPRGYEGKLYTIVDERRDGSQPQFKYVVTWLIPGDIRVVLAANSDVGDEGDVVNLVEDFIESTNEPTTPTPTAVATNPLTPTPTHTPWS